jgi:hypothetical protein
MSKKSWKAFVNFAKCYREKFHKLASISDTLCIFCIFYIFFYNIEVLNILLRCQNTEKNLF